MLLSISTASVAQYIIGGGVNAGSKAIVDDDGSEIMGFGINVRGEFSLMDKFALTPGFTFFFSSVPGNADLTMW